MRLVAVCEINAVWSTCHDGTYLIYVLESDTE
jgi:hypothetical protein